ARKRFHDSLAGTITLTAGLGGMGGAQALAVTLNGGVAICVDVDPERIERRIEHRYLDLRADSLEQALQIALDAKKTKKSISIGVLGNAAEGFPDVAPRGLELRVAPAPTSAPRPPLLLPPP